MKFLKRLFKKIHEDKYKLVVLDPLTHRVIVSIEAVVKHGSANLAHQLFLSAGFTFHRNEGYFYRDGTKAVAFLNNRMVEYPEWY